MSPLSAGVLGAIVGLLLGLSALLLLRSPDRRRAQDEATEPELPEPLTPTLPDGAEEVLDALRAGAIVLDTSGQAVHSSSSAVALGLVRGTELIHDQLRQLARQVQRDQVVREAELELARGPIGAGRLYVGVRVAPLTSGLVLVLVEDRTHARLVEQVRRDFVVNVSHELKTPVGGLALLAEAVEDAADDPVAVARFATRMKTETSRLSRLVSEIVDLSRLQTAGTLSAPVLVDVADCAQEAVEQTRLVAQQRQITVSAISPADQLRIYGDHELVVTAIRNLVANAIAYSDDRTRVSVVVRRQDDLVELSVSDQGTGIPVADQERIFERFYRVDTARSRATGGTGLGLSIVKHICANHGGDVGVWSQEGQGSTFTMRLPAALDDSRPIGSAAPHGRRPTNVDGLATPHTASEPEPEPDPQPDPAREVRR